ncbi:MAG: hypothetical protein CMF59_07875 [Leptospiraceae bacterium]|nr:hypothetical protein [Leptospiraceae bacterium]
MQKPLLETKSAIDLAAMVDVIFLLLAYFLLNSTLGKQPSIQVNLPQSETAQHQGENTLDIFVEKSGQFRLGEETLSLEQIEKKLALELEKNSEREVRILGDSEAPYSSVIAAMDLVRRQGRVNFSLATSAK